MIPGVETPTPVSEPVSETDPANGQRLQVRSLSKSFGRHRAVADFSADINSGQILCLLGPSGCGKTTTLRMIAGLEEPDGGLIAVGADVFYQDGEVVRASHERRLGMVFQSYALWPHMSVYGNVEYPLRRSNLARARRRELVEEVLEQVGLPRFGPRKIAELSGGQQQRVALARAVVGQPRVVLFDEPLSNLDASLRVAMRRDIRRLVTDAALSSLYVTHDQAEALAIADVICVMHEGRVQQRGRPLELVHHPRNRFVAQFLQVGTVIRTPVHPLTTVASPPAVTSTTIELGGQQIAVELAHEALSVTESANRAVCIPSRAVRLASDGIAGRVVWADLAPTGVWELGVEVSAGAPALAVRVDRMDPSVGVGSRCHVEIDRPVILLKED